MLELNTILNEDCLKTMAEMPDNFVQLLIADPPYGQNKGKWDKKPFYREWIKEGCRVTKGSLYIFGKSETLATNWDCFPEPKRWLIWHYKNKPNLNHNTWGWGHDSIVYIEKQGAVFNLDEIRTEYAPSTLSRLKYEVKCSTSSSLGINGKDYGRDSAKGKKPMDVITCPTVAAGIAQREGLGHPTQKPEWLIEQLMKASSNENDIVYDPFSGSGTTSAVAKKLGRQWIGSEISKEWAEVGNKRTREMNYAPKTFAFAT